MNYRFDQKDTVYTRCKHETYNFSTELWSLADPDAGYPKITITDTAGTVKVNAVSMTKISTGKFEHRYQLAADAAKGVWTGVVETANGGYTDKEHFSFEVI